MKQRTTLTAEADDLEVLRAEARRQGLSLNDLLRTAVAEKAAEIQSRKRPRLGIGHSGGDRLGAQSVADEDSPAATPMRD